MLVSLFSFVAFAKMNTDVVNLEGISIFNLGITLYLIVFATSFIRLVYQFQKKEKLIATLKSDNKKNEQENILVRVNRKNQLISLNELAYIESLNDYVKLVTTESEFITREKITNLNKKLPEKFIRIHRSFLVNSDKVNSFTTTEVNILETNLPISRTYKKKAIEILESLPQNP
jgi:DNA-binding LytR/AlgR family response regulator